MSKRRVGQILFLLFFWAFSILILLQLPTPEKLTFSNADSPHFEILRKNEFGTCTFSTWDDLFSYSIHFDKLSSYAGSLGLFKTAAYREVVLANLELKSFVQTNSESSRSDITENPFQNLSFCTVELRNRILKKFQSLQSEQDRSKDLFKINFPNCENMIRLTANGFQYDWYENSEKRGSIKSKRAIYEFQESYEIQLEGHVVLSGNDQILESNSVHWDLQNDFFRVRGNYVLTNDDRKQYGRNIIVDSQLNPVQSANNTYDDGVEICYSEKKRYSCSFY